MYSGIIRRITNLSRFNISIQSIKQLREITGSPINDCKNALTSSNGDIEIAKEFLRARGLIQAQKKLSNAAREGVIGVMATQQNQIVVALEVNCETDFVARTQEFLRFTDNLLHHFTQSKEEVSLKNADEIISLLNVMDVRFGSGSIDEERKLLISKLQENVILSQIYVMKASNNSVFGTYQHNVFGNYPIGMMGSVLELTLNNSMDQVQRQILVEGASNLATSFLGMKPKYITRSDIPQDIMGQERENIITGVPADKRGNPRTLDFIVEGRMKKFYEDNVFTDMEYILDEEEEGITVGTYIKKLEKLMENKEAKISIARTLSLSVK